MCAMIIDWNGRVNVIRRETIGMGPRRWWRRISAIHLELMNLRHLCILVNLDPSKVRLYMRPF